MTRYTRLNGPFKRSARLASQTKYKIRRFSKLEYINRLLTYIIEHASSVSPKLSLNSPVSLKEEI